jgi:hypothetical protein
MLVELYAPQKKILEGLNLRLGSMHWEGGKKDEIRFFEDLAHHLVRRNKR